MRQSRQATLMFFFNFRRRPAQVRRTALRTRPGLETLEIRRVMSSATYVGTTGGDFNNPNNWRDQSNHPVVPGPTTDVYINKTGVVVDLSQSASFHSLHGSGTLLLDDGSLTLTGATNHGTIEIGFNSSLHLVGTDANTGRIKVDPGGNLDTQGVLNNAGVVEMVGGYSHGAIHRPNLSGSGVLNNTGTLLKEGVDLAAGAYLTINDLGGKIDVTGGSLALSKGTSIGGNYTVSTGASLELSNGGDRTISGTFHATGGGLVTITTLYHRLLVADAGATFDFPPGMLEFLGVNIYAATPGSHPNLTNLGVITVPSNDSLLVDAVHIVNKGGTFIRQGNAVVVLQDGGEII
jgi:hypothetical protein